MIENLIFNKINLVFFFVSYLIGSIPFGYILFKYIKKLDIRKYGSGNIGATNVSRLLGKKFGVLTLIFDFLKTALTTFIVLNYLGPEISIFCGAFSIIGHIFPVWLNFKGGKGVASFIGLLSIISWPLFICFVTSWIIIVKMFNYSSLGAIFSIVINLILFKFILILQFNYQVLSYIPGQPLELKVVFFLSVLIIYKHKKNIRNFFNK